MNDIKKLSSDIETRKHIDLVRVELINFARLLIERAMNHDASKLNEPESSIFAEVTEKLSGTTFGSPEYDAFLKELKPALDHHYANNSHHPEHHKDGISDMNLLDIVEMFCDWRASSKRHNDGNINKSLDFNAKRFNIDNQLKSILRNSIKDFV